MSPELRHTLQAWIYWVAAGAPHKRPFRRDDSLCYVVDNRVELKNMFQADGLDTNYPFGEVQTFRDWYNCTCHLNQARVAWVRKVLQKDIVSG